ncbi:Gfo/Idh/MocA family oxidoreductase [Streptomyces sp. Root1310]|uniref:Gfo/Idh/MocA family protein n=1 Tax=Streptomyces sp. Root1310 TaxID=1736452 RepID=UPI000709D45D|nr:Gfo/Idh/MocA family oxidoreductase [Streptomyces sp. Root1310]KQX69468.1 oxidoreductase [Streptomyces sp. Root1310]
MNTSESLLAELARSEKPIGVGIIGLGAHGSWAERSHLPALRAVPGYELRALSSSSKQSAERSGQKHGVSSTFGTAAELAACDEVDLVVVAVKVPHHRELVQTALSAGKSVLCEWPLGNGLAEAEDMAQRARSRAVPTVVGLQARSHPALAYARDLVADGYVGEVLSTTVVGCGGAWGATVGPGDHYVLDAANGATLLTIPFSHTLDALASVLGEPEELRIQLASRRTSAVDTESGEVVPMTAADQVVASGRLPSGAVATFHYRGGMARGTNFRWEINGTEGDLVLTAPIGHPQLSPLTLEGGRGTSTALAPMTVPHSYVRVPQLDPRADAPAYAVAHAYQQFLDDLREGTSGVPDFAHGAARHRSIESVITTAAPDVWASAPR